MPRLTKKQKEQRIKFDALRRPALVALRGVKIGPLWHATAEEVKAMSRGMRGVLRKKTVTPFDDKYRENRRKKNRVAARSRARNYG